MVVKFSDIDFSERPILILKNASDTPLGVLGYAKNVSVDLKYNETSSIEFEVPEFVNGEATPFYNDIAGMRTLELQGIGQFTLISPSENGDGVQRTKACKGYSLEYEFVYKKISLPENTYKFWDEANPQDTLLGMIMELMPSWSIGSVAMTLQNKYRTFEVNNENLYNLIKGTVQKSYGCIFDFDTMTRKVYVRDAAETPANKPVFLSLDNLAKEIEVTENTEDIFTRLDVNGAEGVTIRDVNPTGTNKIINLDYYMTEDNFSPALIAKYNEWKQLCAENKQPYYTCSVQYAVKTSQKITEMAKLTDLRGEMTNLENLQAVAIEGIARGLKTQADLDKVNGDIAAKQVEINAKQTEIDALQTELESIHAQLKAITDACNFEKYFSDIEYKLLDRYLKDGEITESSFVVTEISSYQDAGNSKNVGSISISFNGCSLTQIDGVNGSRIFDIKGGEIVITDDLKASVISAIIDHQANGSFVVTAYLSAGTIAGNTFPSACVSLTGDGGTITADKESASVNLSNGYRYFTLNASEYEKRSVAWELYEYGEEVLNKLAVPSYSFHITSANFLALEEFITFKNALTLGEKVYIDMGCRGVLCPIVIGVRFSFDEPGSMELSFGDSYSSGDSTFRLVDLLEQSISMGKNVEMSKFIYSSFIDSGASTGLREFMTSALDVARNAIMSSSNQAISWDGAGFRLRKWTNESHTAYEPEQIWMNNNSIVMTENNWATAEMAIGKFHDENLGDCWGIVAPRIVGTLLAGESMIIESAKKDGGTAVFRVDGDGCKIFNSDLSIAADNSHIVLNPLLGFAIGTYPVYSVDEEGTYSLIEDNAKFWVDMNGDLHFKGTLHGVNGEFTGSVTATSLTIEGTPASDYVDHRAEAIAQPILDIANNAYSFAENVWNGTSGIFFKSSDVSELALNASVGLKITGSDGTYFQVKNDAMGFFKADGSAMLYYEDGKMTLNGIIAATGGYIGGPGGWTIGTNCIYNGNASTLGSTGGIYLGSDGISVGSAISMLPDGSFIIRGDNTSSADSNYVLKITPETSSDGDIAYKLHLGNIAFDDTFVIPTQNGGTGGTGREDIGSAIGIYRVTSTSQMQNLPNPVNGDLCVLIAEGAEGVSVSGTYTTATSTSPGFLPIDHYNASGHRGVSYFDITNINYWNVAKLDGDTVSTEYARVGAGTVPSASGGLFVPLRISASGAVTSITLNFDFATRPSGCKRDLCSSWSNGISVSLYRGDSTNKIATTTYMIPGEWQVKSSVVRNASVTLTSTQGITSGEYYVAFYTRNVNSLMWIKPASIGIAGKSVSVTDGLYMRSANTWKLVGGSAGGGGGDSISISNVLTSGTRIATLTVNGATYDLYAPMVSGGATGETGGSYVSVYGGVMTGNLTISNAYLVVENGAVHVDGIGEAYMKVTALTETKPFYSFTGRLDVTKEGVVSVNIRDNDEGNVRRAIELRSGNSAAGGGMDDAIVFRVSTTSGDQAYRIFHEGMTSAGMKNALKSLGIFFAYSLPANAREGQICLIPAGGAT